MKEQKLLHRFRIVGIAEGISFLVLLLIAMPLKYLAGFPQAVLIVGWIHGFLFIVYIISALDVKIAKKWSVQKSILEFFQQYKVTSVVHTSGNIGCPHEEGDDFPIGEDCPFCPFWKGMQGASAWNWYPYTTYADPSSTSRIVRRIGVAFRSAEARSSILSRNESR